MALYTLTLRDGSTLQVEAPEGASREDLARAATEQSRRQSAGGSAFDERIAAREERVRTSQEQAASQRAAYESMFDAPDKTGFLGDLTGGFASGVVGVGETAALGAATLLDEEEELAARDRIQRAASAIRPSFGDQEDLTFKIGQTFGSIAGFIGAGAAVTYGAGAAGLGAAGAGIAGLLGAGTLGVGAGAGEASERARAADATQEERNRAARLGALVGSTEALPLRRILGKLTGDLGEEVVQGFRKRVLSALRTGGEEAAQEAGASIAQNLIERGYNIDQAILEGSGEAGALGGGAGATIQVLVDLFAGRRAPSAPPPPEQGELFPGADLGQAPTRVMGDQREMFPDEDLGLAPERPDERQGELFSAQDQQSAAFARTARRADEERARMMGQPIADFEADGDPFLERTKAERDAARAGVARLQRPQQPEPEQRDMIRELEQATIPEEEQRAQAAAREREGLRAAVRGDVAAFEQPDLFALQQEQDRRRLGPEELRRPDQFMDVPEAAETVTPEQPAAMGDLVDMADQRQRAAQEDADIVDQLAAIDAEEAAQQQQAAGLRAESDIETITGQQETSRAAQTARTRTQVLQDTVADAAWFRQPEALRKAFESRLTRAGLRDATATPQEIESLRRASSVMRARPPATPEPVQEAPIQSPPEATQLQEMEARIPERPAQRAPEQLGMEGIRRSVQEAPAREGMPAAEPAAAREVVTRAMLDEMGIAPQSPVRRRLLGKDLNDPTTRQILTSFANQPRTSQAAELGISRRLEGVPEEQGDLFAPRRVRGAAAQQTPARPTTQPAPAAQQNAAQQLELFPETAPGTANVDTTPDQQRDRASVRGGGRGLEGSAGAGGRGVGARTPTTPEPRGLGARVASATPPASTAAAQRAPLEEGDTRRNVMPVLPRRPITDPKTLKPIGEERVGPTSRALAPREKISAKSAPKGDTTQVTKQLADWYEANISAPAKQFVKNLSMSITSPLTIADKTAVLGVLNTKSTKANKATIGAIKKYLGAYPDPALGLQDAIDDVIAGTTNFRRTADTTPGESDFFGGNDAQYLPARGKNAAQAVLDWAGKNMSEATKRWTAGKVVESKNAMQAVEAYESTDLIAKRRELEKAFEGGFDVTSDADNKRLADTLEKLGIDESDPMVRGLMAQGSLFNMAVPPSRHPLSQITTALLRKGDLAGALRSVASTSADPEVAAVAEKLAKVVGDTKVEVVKVIDSLEGVVGRYTEKDNTIRLAEFAGFIGGEPVGGLNTHVLLHEMTHAATVATLAKPGHPLTRKLQKIFDETQEYLPTAYGSTNLNEFVAEAFSNPEFQTQLAGLKIKGEPLTPFAKIKAAISNFLRSLIGKPVKPVESALEQTTSIIDNILAPAPKNIGSGEFFMLSPRAAGKRVAEMLGDVQKQAKPVTKEFAQKFSDQTREFLQGTTPDKAKRTLLGFYPSQAVADVAERSGITGAMDLHKLMEEQRGAINKSDQAVEGVLKSVSNWLRAHKDQVDALNRVVYKSTIEQVDPSKPVTAYANDPEKVKAWRDMRADWRALSTTGGDKIYGQMRDTYKKQYEKMRDVIYGKIDETITDEAARKKLKNEVYARLFETGTIEPYFPLTRSGNYWLSYNTADGEFNVEAFETMAERDRAMTDLNADTTVKDINKFVNINNASYAKAPPSSFVGQTLQTLQANKVPQDVQAEIMRLFIETLPETSFAKSLQRRKGTPGYKEDAIFALKTKAFDLGRQVERLRYSAKIRELQDKISEDNRPRITEENKYILDELDARATFARNPPGDALAQSANRAAFVFTIGFNASSAVVNLSQLPMFVYPMFAGRYGYGAAGRAMHDAHKLVTSSGFERKSDMTAPYGAEKNIKVRAMPSIDNYFELDANGDYVIRKDLNLEPEVRAKVEEIKPLVAMMAARGQLNRSLFADNLGIDSSGRERGVIDTITAASAFMFHNIEVYNRQVTSVSAYQLELARLKEKEPNLSTAEMQTKAAERALYDTQMTNGGSVLETAPRFSQQGIGRVALMYKTYGIQMYYSMFKTVRDGLEAHYAGDKDKRNEAMRQFGGVVGASFVLAGVVGMPLARELMQLINFFFLDEEEDDAETTVRKTIGEGFYKGPLTALLGVDVSSRIGLSGLILQANRFNHDASLEEDVFHYLGGPAWSIITSYNRGFKDIMNGEVERGVEAMLPAGVRNAYQATFRFPNDDGILTRRGDPIMDDLSFGQLAAKFVGFAPAEYTRTQEMNQRTKNVDRAVNSTRTNILRRYYVATRMGDSDERRRMMERIRAFNKRHPTARIDADSMRKSMRQHMETSATMYNGITISPNMQRALKESREEWNQGFQLF